MAFTALHVLLPWAHTSRLGRCSGPGRAGINCRVIPRLRGWYEWYAKDEKLDNESLIQEKYKGIRPAFGYPACPDHRDKRLLFELLGAEEIGVKLTEHCAMTPASSVSGIYIGHPESRYFNVGRIGRDQLEDYARRRDESIAENEKWLAPNLG